MSVCHETFAMNWQNKNNGLHSDMYGCGTRICVDCIGRQEQSVDKFVQNTVIPAPDQVEGRFRRE